MADSIEQKRVALLRQLEELDKEAAELANADLKKALDYLEKNKIDFDKLSAYWKANHAPVVFSISYLDSKTKASKTFERRKGQIGVISKDVKNDLKALGRDKLKEGIKDETAGAKVLESIFSTGKAK
ncbi:MAG: hypothetical protein Q7T70_10270 [Polaromonas sp.]|nr:hypothetical protein [Polaromonas sp.]